MLLLPEPQPRATLAEILKDSGCEKKCKPMRMGWYEACLRYEGEDTGYLLTSVCPCYCHSFLKQKS